MKTLIEQVWKVEEAYDRDSRVVARFSTKELAEELKKTSAYFSVYKENIRIEICESMDDFRKGQIATIRATALAKLTSTERAALGL